MLVDTPSLTTFRRCTSLKEFFRSFHENVDWFEINLGPLSFDENDHYNAGIISKFLVVII